MKAPSPHISAYVLAGGRSSRMGTDKALLPLAGKPLIAHAVAKLLRITPDVHILGANPALASYAPLVPDLHPGTGPIGGVEAALVHSAAEWVLLLPVDVPFLPTLLLERWVRSITQRGSQAHRVALFSVSGRPQPALLLLHRSAGPSLSHVIAKGEYKLMPALETAARELAAPDGSPQGSVPFVLPVEDDFHLDDGEGLPADAAPWHLLTDAQRASRGLWFANLNTPEDFADAQTHLAALDT